jgi:tight adherence protein C
MATVAAFLGAGLLVCAVGLLVPTGGQRQTTARSRPPRRPALLRVITALGTAIARKAAPLDAERRLAAAGRPAGLGPRELMAAKAGGALAFALPGVVLGAIAPGRLGVLAVAAAPVAGFFAADVWLARRAAERARRVRRELPQLLDLLRVTVDAGVSLPAALLAVGESADGVLAREWRAVGREVAIGSPLGEALAGMEARVPLAEVGALARALDRTRRHGVPLGDTLAGQARDARLLLARRVREDAARAGPKIQLVVALLLVPSVLLLVAAALAAALLGGQSL